MTGNGRCAIRCLVTCIAVLFLLPHLATGAHAACTNPDRAIGKIVFSADNNLFQGCTARGWMGLHHGVTASSGGGPLTQVGTVTSLDLDGANGVAVSGGYAYVANTAAGSLTVIDISNPTAPAQMGTVSTADLDGAVGVAVAGSYVYVASNNAGSLTVIDVSNPATPAQVGTISTTALDGARGVAVAGSHAYVGSVLAGSLTVIDVSNPATPAQVGTISTAALDGARGVAVAGSHAYVASLLADSLTVIDVSNPAAPVQVGAVSTADLDDAYDVAVFGNHAYVGSVLADSLTVIDVSNPAAPVQVGTISTAAINMAFGVAVSGNYAYVTGRDSNSLTIIDVSNPATPVQVGTISTTALDGARGVAVVDNRAYVASGDVDSLTVIDLGSGGDCTGPARPSGGIVFNADHDAFQGCAGGQWVAFHGTGTPGGATDCTAPTKPVGALFFNEDYDVFQGCTTRGWKAFHAMAAPPPVLCTNIGDVCADGSYYIGQVGGNDIYATAGASESNQTWNNGTTNWTITGFTSTTDGPGNTAGLVALADAGAPYDAAEYCDGLSAHGHGDWYLPARDELNLFYNGGAPVAGVSTSGNWYWSSTEYNHDNAWVGRFSDGFQHFNGKNNTPLVRCVRRSDTTPDAFSFEGEIDVATSTLIESDNVQITGMDDGTAVSITGDGSPEYRICADATCSAVNHGWSSGAGSIDAGEYLQLRLTSNAANGMMHSATVTVGTASDQWDVTTDAGGPTGCPNIGDLCSDGSYYIGQLSGNEIYATAPASQSSQAWNNSTSNWTVTGYTSTTDGHANTAGLVALSDAGSPYNAAEYCDGLAGVHGHSDWYLPAKDELNLFWNGGARVAGVLSDGTYYWSSTENANGTTWRQRFSNGTQGIYLKDEIYAVRCVRR